MKTRILSGIVLALITISSLLVGSWYLFFICMAISLIGEMELCRIVGIHKEPIAFVGYIFTILYYICVYFQADRFEMLIMVGALMCIMTVYVITFPRYSTEQIMLAVVGILYVSVMLSYIYKIRIMENGIYMVWLVYISSWINDTFAYFTGVTFGKHKMTPKLSPKKSVEGAIGGIVASAIVGGLYGFIVSAHMSSVKYPVVVFAVASAIGAILAIVGDLTASGIKRNHDIKDYGKLIPGHGGILDRYDSVIFTAPSVYWVIIILIYVEKLL